MMLSHVYVVSKNGHEEYLGTIYGNTKVTKPESCSRYEYLQTDSISLLFDYIRIENVGFADSENQDIYCYMSYI